MASGQWGFVLRHVQRLFLGGSVSGLTEGQLLERFASDRDEVCFGAIVARHGPMVLGVCRGVLDDPSDVEDAFQATFLVLVRKAAGLRDRDLLGPWLYGVARRVALRARSDGMKRKARERAEVEAEPAPVASFDAELRELQALVREEVDRLPGHDRMAVVFCYLEGLTHEEAAERLGWPVGTVKGRLSRAREKLRDRLSRRGVTLPAIFALTPPGGLPTAVPPSLIDSTVLAATRLAAGQTLTAGIVSAHAVSLMEGVIDTMFATKLKIAAAPLVATCAVVVPGVMAYQGAGPTATPARALTPPRPSAPAQVPKIVDNAAPATPEVARDREDRIKLARQALQMIAEIAAAQDADPDVASFDLWSRRLAEAEGGMGASGEERIKAFRSHRDRMEGIFQRAASRVKSGQVVPLTVLDAQYRRDEAARLLAEAKAEPAPTAARPTDAINGGGGTAPDRPILSLGQAPADERRNEAIRSMLEKPISMNFPSDTPLEDVKKYIEQSTQDEAAGLPMGIPIYFDPDGLQVAEKTMASTITIILEGIPLRTTLRLALRQLHLAYRIEGGLLLISDEASIARQQKAEDARARKQ